MEKTATMSRLGHNYCRLFLFYGLVAAISELGYTDEGHHWSYEGETDPDHWPEMFHDCAGERQSPIDIKYANAEFNEDLPDIDFDEISGEHSTLISNNGHTMSMEPTYEIHVNGGGLSDIYKVAQAHFHWGKDSSKGSEHQVNGAPYPLEMHIVTYNFERYSASVDEEGFSPVLESGDGSALAVFGVFFTLTAHNNTKFNPLLKHLSQIRTAGSVKANVSGFDLLDLLPSSTREYYRYEGSLTTPTCNEIVMWTLFEEKNTISEYQLQEFRKLLTDEGHPLVDNWRPVQPLNTRKVQKSFKVPPYNVDEQDGQDGPSDTAVLRHLNIVLLVISAMFAVIARK